MTYAATARWERPIEQIFGKEDRVTFIPLALGQTLPPAGLPTGIRLGSAATAGDEELDIELVDGTGLPLANCLYLAFEHPDTGEEFLVELDGEFEPAPGTPLVGTIAIKELEEDIPEDAIAKFPHRLLGLTTYSGGGRSVDFAASTPINRRGWERVQPTTRSNESTAEAEFYALGADYLALNHCLNNALPVWIREETNTPKAGFRGEIREFRAFVGGMERSANTEVPMCNWTFRRDGEEFFTRAALLPATP